MPETFGVRQVVSSSDSQVFLELLARHISADERLVLCGFPGDPNEAEVRDWRPWPWRPGRQLPFGPRMNAYVTVSCFGRAPDGSWRRRTAHWAAGLAMMVDDVGTKVQRFNHAPPTAVIETSPGNEQWWYILHEPEREREKFDGIIRAFIAGKLLGADPGMAGVNRVGRLPGFTNGKAAYGGDFKTRLLLLEPQRLWNVDALLQAFELKLPVRQPYRISASNEMIDARVQMYLTVERFLRNHGLLKRRGKDVGGWTEMHCPWVAEHTAGADTGAAIRQPAAENGYFGAFRCHHGHCEGRGWQELTEWIAEHAEQRLRERNARAPETLSEALDGGDS